MKYGPSFLPEVKAQWRDQLDSLQAANTAAEKKVASVQSQLAEGEAVAAQLDQAKLAQLEAAQNYNSFLELDRQYIRMAMDAETRNQQRDLTILEHIQLATTRETMYALSAHFTEFKSENQAPLLMLPPVDADGHTHYVDGRVEWNDSFKGMAGQAFDEVKALAAEVGDILIRGPFTQEENFAICQSALGSMIPEVAGVVISAPGGRPGGFLWDEALGQSLDVADPAGNLCRTVYPKQPTPRDMWIQGEVNDSGDAAAEDGLAQFVPLSVLDATVQQMFADVHMQALWDGMADAIAALTGQDGLPRWGDPESWSGPLDEQVVAELNASADDAAWDGEAFAPGIAADELWYRQSNMNAEWNEVDGDEHLSADPWRENAVLVADGSAGASGLPAFGDQVDTLVQAMADVAPEASASQPLKFTPYVAVSQPVLASSSSWVAV